MQPGREISLEVAMARKELAGATVLYPLPVIIVTCADEAGRTNAVTLAWNGIICSEPPMLSISIRPGRFSHPMIAQTGEFVVNIPTVRVVTAVDYCGHVSGRDVEDKIKEAGLTAQPASKVRAPLIRECPVCLQCRVKQVLSLGTHDMFVAEIVAVDAEESVMRADATIDPEKAAPVAYMQGDYWSLGQRIGVRGMSQAGR
jgi:flavin reductase (DIM6/NTAB) family NADH-FMN oxidoreductase RutF